MQKVVLASNNVGKIEEFQTVLVDFPLIIVPQAQLNVPEVDETGLTFVENAIIKARHAAKVTDLPAIADDSGLVVDALHGAPGVYSSRYAGVNAGDQANIAKLLGELAQVSADNRSARFYCTIVYLSHATDPSPIICQGVWEGRILLAPCGEQGFGYDPIFYVPTHHCSAAKLPLVDKNKLSHRGQALQQFIYAYSSYLSTDLTAD